MTANNSTRPEGVIQVLLVEDERKLAAAIAEGLERSGYGVTMAHTGERGIECTQDRSFHVVILDIMLPRQGGLETLRELRRSGFRTPVLMLTARGSVEDRVRGLDAGADDYLVKPFAFPELLARVRALHRRGTPAIPSVLDLANLRVDISGRSAVRGGKRLELTEREFDLLEYLMMNRGIVVSREMLARDVWKTTVRHTSIDNVIDVHIARIRRKLDDPYAMKLLHTVRGVGFILRVEGE